ncbi:MAG: 30S ribosome-binding factor RbfA [Treponema sp.]
MGQYRMQRLDAQLREEISSLLLRGEIKDPRVSNFLSINRVAVSSDLSYAQVYVSTVLSDAQLEKGVDGLNNAAGFIQSSIAKKLRIRKFPKFTFVVDKGMKEGFHMVQRLTELEKESEAVNADGADAVKNTENDTGNDIEREE